MLHSLASFFAPAFAQATPRAAEGASATPQPPAEVLFAIAGIPVTNSIFTAWVVIAILVRFAYFSTRNMKSIPSGAQNFWELIIELCIGVTEHTTGRRRGRQFLP